MAAKVDDGIEVLSCNYDRNDINLTMSAAKEAGVTPASGVTAPERLSISTKTTTSTMSTPVPSATPTPTPTPTPPSSVTTRPERSSSRRSRRSEGSVKVRGEHHHHHHHHKQRGDHYQMANQEEYDEESEVENGRTARVDGSVAVKTPDDFKEDDNENNPYRKKVARVVVVISVIMLVMSILLVCVSLNMSKNIDDLGK